VPSPTSPRNPLTRARFLLAQAEALSGFEQEAFDNFVQAAIIVGQSVYEYMASAPTADGAYRDWLRAKGMAMEADPLLAYFRTSRNLLVHRRHVPVQRRIFGTGWLSFHFSAHGEGRVTRSEPWYRRSVGILFHDAVAPVMRPIRRMRYRLGEAPRRRLALCTRGSKQGEAGGATGKWCRRSGSSTLTTRRGWTGLRSTSCGRTSTGWRSSSPRRRLSSRWSSDRGQGLRLRRSVPYVVG